MDTRRIGSLTVSVIGLGCNNFGGRLDAKETDAVVGTALEEGITLFDTADVYGGSASEEFLGQALGRRRDEVVVATKFGYPYKGHQGGASPAYVAEAAEESLRRLGTDRIDLFQVHIPDPKTPLEDTMAALEALVAAGKVIELGCSNFDADQLRAAAASPGGGFASIQNQYSILHREPEAAVLPECAASGTAFVPFFPLAQGMLTGKYTAGEPPPPDTRLAGLPAERTAALLTPARLERVDALEALAARSGHSVAELAIAWLLRRRELASVIAGATSADQVRANVAAGAWVVPDEVAAEVDAIAPA
jgi:aryl-alcohol dehydrogenase-like predicted oxidoreductase